MAVLLITIGCFQLLKGNYYKDVSQREATTVGTLFRVHHGKGSTYEYQFQINGVSIRDDSDTCKTALTSAGCVKGAQVLVYYDRNDLTETLLQEFGAASREKIFFGGFMAVCGLLLIGLHFIFKKALKSPDESEEVDEDAAVNEPEVIHVVPTSDATSAQ
ncbi:MAG TPA: DUF3592 domain-containing protein [Terracidiphilus sp.]|nr:DUF3592 domain-containing protein [Terracidiphilus sp.]